MCIRTCGDYAQVLYSDVALIALCCIVLQRCNFCARANKTEAPFQLSLNYNKTLSTLNLPDLKADIADDIMLVEPIHILWIHNWYYFH